MSWLRLALKGIAAGFEYWSDPDKPEDGFITWQTNSNPTYRLGASAVGPDQGVDGSMVGQRRIPEEPMVRVIRSTDCQ